MPLNPQHFTSPPARSTHVWYTPAAMAIAVRSVPRSTVGRLLPISSGPSPRMIASPSPSCPALFLPQHFTSPPSRITHRSEEHTSELQSLMRISSAVFCLKKKQETLSKQHK